MKKVLKKIKDLFYNFIGDMLEDEYIDMWCMKQEYLNNENKK